MSMSNGSSGSFIDHGPKADYRDGSRPQWIVDKTVSKRDFNAEGARDHSSGNSLRSSTGSEMSDVSPMRGKLSVDVEGVVSALCRERKKTKRLLRDKRRLEGEVIGLKRENTSLLECNRLLAEHNSSLAASVTTLVMKHDQTQFAVTSLASQTQEIGVTVKMLYEKTAVK
ncbi:uncharacterized protein TEOVI_000208200 [Trypanosoma equiperdum]|uniref:Uncharacterized protein n=5 Tax=Trypanozoon TaxID=39700 RepID=Q57Z04_TRYB2|nr:hypothetical protein, conserved [Trypanosoma brucei gambiense DAL972]XP_845115.1 hypothetical protein, conserved [Trypanosoma brucei brucei TREU927]AAX70761.1 hypothetical protein, conserved [Trypanosoma brucei]RHW72516.1 hypothetical protein DPX39_050050500 [Trypanosoma brucei equiperdum]SCU70508.1 hypothetical protein, conserved [Trypanosoma equiperdum]AAX80593.1 hypothetical protein, conserved [Trypanosoma brucei]AAZ11556.1 hypothetical protein, conserved [Trypanosoma brucei brucei TREU|eukprot:XP_011773746.1 hypothetical protein, conserved [Trypanosoma brucei gambiense DAL972]